jgi:4-hydroxybenzoate polyprenyltransferase
VLDAPYDRFHPTKRLRPTVSGLVSIPIAKMQWVLMGALGVWLGFSISSHFGIACVSLWLMGCVYNIEPLRTKDVAYLDVPSESVNNPIRLLMGWYIVTDDLVPPISLVIGYWMVGCYFMAVKRFSEFREIGQSAAAAYRRSFRRYSEQSLLVSVMFYASAAMLFFGAFIARYRLELVLGFPLIALVMAIYLLISYEPGSAVQHPERLHSDWRLMLPVVVTSVVLCVLLFVDVPGLYTTFTQTVFKGVGRPR